MGEFFESESIFELLFISTFNWANWKHCRKSSLPPNNHSSDESNGTNHSQVEDLFSSKSAFSKTNEEHMLNLVLQTAPHWKPVSASPNHTQLVIQIGQFSFYLTPQDFGRRPIPFRDAGPQVMLKF